MLNGKIVLVGIYINRLLKSINFELNLNPSQKIPTHCEKISTPHPQKTIATLPENFSIP